MAAQAIEGLAFPEEKKKYIVEVLDPLLEPMVQELLSQVPADPTEFMIQWLRKRGGVVQGPSRMISVAQENIRLKKELRGMRELMNEAASSVVAAAPADKHGEEEAPDSEEDEDDDVADDMPPPPQNRGQRASVSAEAYGNWNQVKAFTPPVHPKTPEQVAKLATILNASFMFSSLDKKDMDTVIGAMQQRDFEASSRIITEGDDGEHLYVIEEGSPVCKKKVDGEEKVVKTCGPGDVFGELALLYNCPRAATVEAVDSCKAWELDRDTFNYIVKDAATKRNEQRDNFLKKIELLTSIDQYERAQICDALKCETFSKDQMVVTQGDEGNSFYIVESGGLVAIKNGAEVMKYSPGDYFGELALLKSQPRACSVKVTDEEATLLTMDRKAFIKLLGPLEQVLRRKEAEYEKCPQ